MNKGFTLVELLIAITIIAILSTVGLVAYSGIQRDSRDQNRLSSLRLIEQSLEHLRNQKGHYPPGSNQQPKDISEISLVMVDIPNDPLSTGVFKYSALPAGCDNLSSLCLDFILCGRKEGSKPLSSVAGCNSISCSDVDSSISCGLGFSSQ